MQISDDEDTVRLRILADTHQYKAGDVAEVQVHWREKPALALVTYQGAKVLDYKLVELKEGANKLSIPMAANLAPNFELSVTVMTDTRAIDSRLTRSHRRGSDEPADEAVANDAAGEDDKKPIVRFHTANSHFSVARDLKVTLETKRKAGAKGPIRPGEELELIVKATDPQGKPVVAELSVAMVEQSLLAMFASQLPAIRDYFAGGTRDITVRSGSSITFNYHPATRAIDKQLLAEAERLEIAAEEAARLSATNPFGVAGGDQPLAPRGATGIEMYDADGAVRVVELGTNLAAVDELQARLSLHFDQRQQVQSQAELGEVAVANQLFEGGGFLFS